MGERSNLKVKGHWTSGKNAISNKLFQKFQHLVILFHRKGINRWGGGGGAIIHFQHMAIGVKGQLIFAKMWL